MRKTKPVRTVELSALSIADTADKVLLHAENKSNSLWAKSGRKEGGWLSLPQHMADSACAADYVWETWLGLSVKTRLAELSGLEVDEVKSLYVFLAASHDVGKGTPSFQILVDNQPGAAYLIEQAEAAGFRLDSARMKGQEQLIPHSRASEIILKEWLKQRGINTIHSGALAMVSNGHHGIASQTLRTDREEIQCLSAIWKDAQHELLEALVEVSCVSPVLDKIGESSKPLKADFLMLLTGLVIMADWIASDETLFPLAGEDQEFTQEQFVRAQRAFEKVDLSSAWQPTELLAETAAIYQKLFGWAPDVQVRPMQSAAVEQAQKSNGPTLMIIEAPTGSGKTEAGLAAAHILGSAQGSQGVFFAAPTMATANGLFHRFSEWAARASHGETVTTLYLAHSKNRLEKEFRQLRFRPTNFASIGRDEEPSGMVTASQWLSGSKKGVLANFALGTIDQVLMLSLQMRHSMLRHIGLAGKIIIIDEAHAFDIYMSEYLFTTLAWLARYGVSVVLMSATLAPQQRQKLAEAYASEICPSKASSEVSELAETTGYPLLTTVNAEGVNAQVIEGNSDNLTIAIHEMDDDLSELIQKLDEKLHEGGIALVMCNTIRRAQETFEAVSNAFPGETELHHSAFVARERSDKEEVLRTRLGPDAHRGGQRPDRLIVVATQVVEQSLDIDVDVLFTDIAPMDLIIQRIGRLARHERPISDRPESVRTPEVFIRAVNSDGVLPEFDSGAQAIYGQLILLATYANLPKSFARPQDVEPLVRNVYTMVEADECPAGWEEAWIAAKTDARRMRESAQAKAQAFKIPEPRDADKITKLFHRVVSTSASDEETGHAQVRDAEPSVEAIAIESTEDGYRPLGLAGAPFISDGVDLSFEQALRLAESTVRLPAWMTRFDKDFEDVIRALELQTPTNWAKSSILKGKVAIDFSEDNFARLGRFLLTYDSHVGLQVRRAEGDGYA